MKTAQIANYTFDKAAKTVTFTDFSSIELNRVLNITDVTNGVQIYTYRLAGLSGTVATNVLTLNFNTNDVRFNDSDKLLIEYIVDNYPQTIVSSAARTESFNGSEITNYDAKGAVFAINATAVSGTDPILTVKVQMKEPVSGNWIDIPGAVTGNITGTGQTLLTVYPGLTVSANAKIDYPLPRTYRAVGTISGTTPSFTFSVSANYIN